MKNITYTLLFICTLFTSLSAQVSTELIPPPPPPPPSENVCTDLIHIIEEMPQFPGCEDIVDRSEKKKCADEKLIEFIYSNFKYPQIAKESKVEGTVVVRFYIDKDGSMKDPKILKDIGAGCGEEALRIIKLLQEKPTIWVPGTQRGKAVKVNFNMPVRFKL